MVIKKVTLGASQKVLMSEVVSCVSCWSFADIGGVQISCATYHMCVSMCAERSHASVNCVFGACHSC